MSKSKRPSTFILGVFKWRIHYLDIEHENFGETLMDTREINIIIRNKSEQVIKDTLLHECLHVCFEDIIDTTSKIELSSGIIEEQIVRLFTPRLHSLLSDNPKLRDYIFQKPIDSPKKL